MKKRSVFLSLLLAGLATGALAQSGNEQNRPGGPGGPGGEGPHRGPPPEAIAACKGKSSDAPCSFTGRQGETLSGTCFTPPPPPPGEMQGNNQTRPSACRPSRDGNRGPGGPGGPGGQDGPMGRGQG